MTTNKVPTFRPILLTNDNRAGHLSNPERRGRDGDDVSGVYIIMYKNGFVDIPSSTISAISGFVNKANKVMSSAGDFVATRIVLLRK
jgi:hypothetical protein